MARPCHCTGTGRNTWGPARQLTNDHVVYHEDGVKGTAHQFLLLVVVETIVMCAQDSRDEAANSCP